MENNITENIAEKLELAITELYKVKHSFVWHEGKSKLTHIAFGKALLFLSEVQHMIVAHENNEEVSK